MAWPVSQLKIKLTVLKVQYLLNISFLMIFISSKIHNIVKVIVIPSSAANIKQLFVTKYKQS